MIWAWLLLLTPLSLALKYWIHAPPLWVFVVSAGAIIPLAEWIRRATEQMAKQTGPAIGGLLNVSFGNAAELLLALFVLESGNQAVVKGQITGSLIGTLLLGLGIAILAGSRGRDKQTFQRERAGRLGSLLILAVIALLLPAVFDYTERGGGAAPNLARHEELLSLGVAVVLIAVYAANLVYTLAMRRNVFASGEEDKRGDGADGAAWPLWIALGVLAGATALTGWEAEMVSGALTQAASALSLTPFFLGVVVLAVIGNAAEFVASIYFARQNKMGLVMSLTVGSSIQVALLIAPLLVIISHFLGHPMTLVFTNPLELIAIAGAAFAVNAIAQDGETNWFEGILLVAVYLLLAMAFFFVR